MATNGAGRRVANRYELIDELGHGGMGTVWIAWDRKEDCYRAAKVLRQADAAALLPVFRALTVVSSPFTAVRDLRGLLNLALGRERGNTALPLEHPTELQRAYLKTMADSDGLWAPGTTNFTVLLKGLGLPQDRSGLRLLAERA
jgi:serine/threonine protein kinase